MKEASCMMDARKMLPGSGWKFCPDDEELVSFLERRILNESLPCGDVINDVSLYDYDVEDVIEKYRSSGHMGKWYFFTDRHRKYPNGSRPARSTPNGFWRATVADTEITNVEGQEIGMKRTLNFYRGRQMGEHQMTDWMMQEYIIQKFQMPKQNGSTLDLVLCMIYAKEERKKGSRKRKCERKGDPVASKRPWIQTPSPNATVCVADQNQISNPPLELAQTDPDAAYCPHLNFDPEELLLQVEYNNGGGLIRSNPRPYCNMTQHQPHLINMPIDHPGTPDSTFIGSEPFLPSSPYYPVDSIPQSWPDIYFGPSRSGLIDNGMTLHQQYMFSNHGERADQHYPISYSNTIVHPADTPDSTFIGSEPFLPALPYYNTGPIPQSFPDIYFGTSQPSLIDNRMTLPQQYIFNDHGERAQQHPSSSSNTFDPSQDTTAGFFY